MKVEKTINELAEILCSNIPIGTVFGGIIAKEYGASVFLCTYDEIVDLEAPRRTWSQMGVLKVKDYTPYPNAKVVLNG